MHNLPKFPKSKLPRLKRSTIVPPELIWVFENIGYGGESFVDANQNAFMEPISLADYFGKDFAKLCKDYDGDPLNKIELDYIKNKYNKVVVFYHFDHGDEVQGFDYMTKKVIFITIDRDRPEGVENRLTKLSNFENQKVGDWIRETVIDEYF